MDFDDLLFNTNVLFQEHPDVLNKYQQRFKYLLIDEFQDTNISQYLIAKRLAAVRQNIAVVGDDAQSIYAFRGADIQNILNFERDYPDLKVIKLEQNYRSTKTIVNAANSVINKNTAQLQKNVWTDNDEGDLIELIKATSDNEEGKLIASAIFETKMETWKGNRRVCHFVLQEQPVPGHGGSPPQKQPQVQGSRRAVILPKKRNQGPDRLLAVYREPQ